jgi:hypothetical protein
MAKLLKLGLSANLVIGGKPLPLESSLVEIPSGADVDLTTAIEDALNKSVEFRLPPGFALEFSIDEFADWLDKQGFDPIGLSSIVTGTSVVITNLAVSTKGKFDITLSVEFKQGLIPGDFGDFFDVKEIGLRLAYDPDESDDG